MNELDVIDDRGDAEREEDFLSDYAAVQEWLQGCGRDALSRVAVSGVMDKLDELLGREEENR